MKPLPGSRLLGIIGYPLGHSLSPAMHNAAFQHLGLDYHYVSLSVKPGQLANAIEGIKFRNLAGCNVTIPYKEQVIPFLDHLDMAGMTIGAVNTISNCQGKLWGFNTDGSGFLRSLTEELKMDVQGMEALLLGAGGAARAVAYALVKAGLIRLWIANRSFSRGQKIANELGNIGGCIVTAIELQEKQLEKVLLSAHLLVNTLPLGMYPQVEDMPPVKGEWLRPPLTVCDLIYNPLKTKLLQKAEERGCHILNGVGMLVYQGAESFEIWTGYEAPVEVMRKTVMEKLIG